MNFKAMFAAAGLAVAAMGMTGTAEARDRWDDHRGGHHDRWDRYDRHDRWDRHDRHDRWNRLDRRSWRDRRRWERSRHASWRHRDRCWTEWRWGETVRVCR